MKRTYSLACRFFALFILANVGSLSSYAQCPPAVLTISGSSTICAGAGVTYTSSTNVTGGAIEWFVNGQSAWNGGTYTYNPINGDIVTAVVTTPTASCYLTPTDTSNAITMVVDPNIAPVVSTIANNTSVCPGTPVTFTATTNVTGGTYQWQVNGVNAGTGGSSYTYTPANNDAVRVISVAPAGGCYVPTADTSSAISITVNPNITPTLSISTQFTAICAGTAVTFSSNTNIAGGSMLWKVNGNTVATNVTSYTYTPANNDVITAVYTVPGTVCTVNPVVTSNAVTMMVTQMLTPSVIISGPASAGEGQSVTLTATLTNSGNPYALTWKNKGTIINTTSVPTLTYTKGPGIDTITAELIPLSNGCWAPPTTNVHIVSDMTGIAETMKAAGIAVYPNPFSNSITLKGLKLNERLMLTNLTGRTIYTWQATKEIQTFKAEGLAAGHYILKIMNEQGAVRVNVPVVKQ